MIIINSFFCRLKAYVIYITTGWRSVKYIGLPKEIGRYIVCLQNNTVTEFNFGLKFGDDSAWFKIAISSECQKNPVKFWKKFPNHPKIKLEN